jgi:hypothetical protein
LDPARVDLVIQYVLAAAGERDGGEREVTATQTVKYAFLADAAHAAKHGGATFTGAPWVFSHLGPHSPEVEARVPVVARRIGAATRASYYLLDRDDLGHRRAAAAALPPVVMSSLMQSLRGFSRDTNALLAHVYAADPVRRAHPGSLIDFTPDEVPPVTVSAEVPALSPRARAALKARRAAAAAPAAVAAAPAYPPRYDDDVFTAGHRALDAADRPLVATQGALAVDPGVWDAPGRRERDVP